MKNLLQLFFFLFVSLLFSQKLVLTNSLKTNQSVIKQVIPIINNETNNFSLFFIDAKNIYAYLYNDKFEQINSLKTKDKQRKYKILLGNSISNNDYRLYLANNNYSKFASFNFSFNTNKTKIKEIPLNLKNEKFIQAIDYNNSFYILTINKNTPIINIYTFNENGEFVKNEIDFKGEKFANYLGTKVTLNSILKFTNGFIKENNPNSLETTSNFTKLYTKDNFLIFTFDENKNYTQIIKININTFKKEIIRIKKPVIFSKSGFKKSNSYIFNDYIFMLTVTKEKLNFTIKNFQKNILIKEYKVTSNDILKFKNTPFLKNKGINTLNKKNSAKRFIKDIARANIGISVHKFNNNYQVTLGGNKVENQNNALVGAMFGASGILLYSLLNSTTNSYNSYANVSNTYIKSVFDDKFNHIKGGIKKNAFDKIKYFKKDNGLGIINIETIFKHKNHFLYGYYNNRSEDFYLYKFKDDK